MPYRISENCVGCGACAKKCPHGAITGEIKVGFHIDAAFCEECGACFQICPNGAVADPEGSLSPAKGKKKKRLRARIDSSICAGCRTCFLNCPQDAIRVKKKTIFSNPYCEVDAEKCVGCGTCMQFCITGAIELV